MKNLMKGLLFLGLTFCGVCAQGQRVAVKTNLLYDALYTVNLGVEVGMAPRWTLDVSGNYNGWTLSHERRWKHWLVQPEARYWFCDRFAGHFLGMHILGGKYNIGGLKTAFRFWVPISRKSRSVAIRAGSPALASPMATHGFWVRTGIWKRSWASDGSIRDSTVIRAPDADESSPKTGRIIMWGRPRRLLIWFIPFNSCSHEGK